MQTREDSVGGAKNFQRVAKGGRKILNMTYFFQLTKIQCFLVFLWFLGCFEILGQRGGEKFSTRPEGGAKNFQSSIFFYPWVKY